MKPYIRTPLLKREYAIYFEDDTDPEEALLICDSYDDACEAIKLDFKHIRSLKLKLVIRPYNEFKAEHENEKKEQE